MLACVQYIVEPARSSLQREDLEQEVGKVDARSRGWESIEIP
jgi:hypothetical protein